MKKILKFFGAIFGPFRYISSRKVSGKLEEFFAKRPYLIYVLAIVITLIILVTIYVIPQFFNDEIDIVITEAVSSK